MLTNRISKSTTPLAPHEEIMTFRNIAAIIFCFFLIGCIPDFFVPEAELTAQAHIAQARSHEKSLKFEQAIKEYTAIARQYPGTRYHKQSVWKVILLSIHPNNSKTSYTAALDWLQIYSTLALSPEEEENALIIEVLIRQAYLIQEEKNRLAAQIEQYKKKNTTLAEKLQQSRATVKQIKKNHKKLSIYKAEFSDLKAKLAVLKDKLQKMKEIDVQVYKTRKNSGSKPIRHK